MICPVSDASHGGEEEWLDEWEIREPFRSQGGRLILLCNRDVIEGTQTHCHLVSFSSNVVRRVCRSTIQAESYQLQLSVEHADLIRASIVDAMGLLNRREWEESAQRSSRQSGLQTVAARTRRYSDLYRRALINVWESS